MANIASVMRDICLDLAVEGAGYEAGQRIRTHLRTQDNLVVTFNTAYTTEDEMASDHFWHCKKRTTSTCSMRMPTMSSADSLLAASRIVSKIRWLSVLNERVNALVSGHIFIYVFNLYFTFTLINGRL